MGKRFDIEVVSADDKAEQYSNCPIMFVVNQVRRMEIGGAVVINRVDDVEAETIATIRHSREAQ